jgi:hypothetical protein
MLCFIRKFRRKKLRKIDPRSSNESGAACDNEALTKDEEAILDAASFWIEQVPQIRLRNHTVRLRNPI